MYDKLIFELSKQGRRGYSLPAAEVPAAEIPEELRRKSPLDMPEVTELDVVRHYTNLSRKNYGVDQGFYPLGSCTMKYNPKINEELASLSAFARLHPLQPASTAQGALAVYFHLEEMLKEVTGMAAFSFSPFAGAHGEACGLMIMKKYHQSRGDYKRTKIIVPDTAHGTNPASASVVGFDTLVVGSTPEGTVDVEKLKELLNDEIAGIMLTNPNTLGIFEKDIMEIARLMRENGSLLYYDGANLNALLGVARPAEMGFDIIHLNLHKTFSTPHGGGGPGSGPVGVRADLADFLPNPRVVKRDDGYALHYSDASIGAIGGFYGNFLVVLKAYAYLLSLGKEHLDKVGKFSVLNANYIKESLKDDYLLPINGLCKHEVVFDGLIKGGATTLDVAKRLLDYGYHPPTIYFPLLYHQSLMIEPTEAESKETIDDFIAVMKKIAAEAVQNPELLKEAPHNTPVRRLDEVKAARQPVIKYKDMP
ncbi:MAG: aminomethyl-transferring glycine dehydrogenase subunit GcvPB [Bacilli bacterium]|jgi:glycine dehydrogenase subunit 2|nr:aminomethyl-transferring glycine dehydrogenase subunit GcvPB [Bacilli bacterium]HPZ27657.1 aminomethyl-transferring glycine dehydrogenase subunit GcvPB [Bacilli bacterium]HQC89988.1 aminomethyl-transferring glycine dehydrogenase subunit GcvPB [Bacilli bacterium]